MRVVYQQICQNLEQVAAAMKTTHLCSLWTKYASTVSVWLPQRGGYDSAGICLLARKLKNLSDIDDMFIVS